MAEHRAGGRVLPGRAAGARARGPADRGSSVIELAILTPALMMLCMLILQFGLWFNARQAALASAQAGATVAREEAASTGAWAANAQAAATQYFDGLHTRLLSKLRARASGDPHTNVSVTVSGPLGFSVFSFFDLNLTVSATAGGPVECFRSDEQDGC